MKKILKISLVQFDIYWENIDENLKYLDYLLNNLKTDLIVLPEMFTTGFTPFPQKSQNHDNKKIIDWMMKISKSKNSAICGSTIFKVGDEFYNRFLFIHENRIQHYDKKHLFSYGGESRNFKPGKSKTIIDFHGWKICPQICYDLRFPVWSRNTENYDLLLYVANWPEKRKEHWMSLLKARSIENQSYVVGLNRVGRDEMGLVYSGDSLVFDPLGNELLHMNPLQNISEIIVDKNLIESTRREFPFLLDKDNFNLNI